LIVAGFDRRVRRVVEVGQRLGPEVRCLVHAAGVAVVALGQQELGEETLVLQVFSLGRVGDLGVAFAQGGRE
jgi:hypothetical protein